MRIVFMGSPKEVTCLLDALCELSQKFPEQYNVVAVVSQPAKAQGRSKALVNPPVVEAAHRWKLPVFQPQKASAIDFLETLRELRPDVIVTAAYGQILSQAFLDIPARATINVHPSLLPLLRGATPVQSALLAGFKTSGVSILFTVKALDAGAIILQQSSLIGDEETAGQLTQRLFQVGAQMLPEALEKLNNKFFQGIPQDDSKATFCRKIQKSDGLVRWAQAADNVLNQYRAFEPWPGSYTFIGSERINLKDLKHSDVVPAAFASESSLPHGSWFFDKQSALILVKTGNGSLSIAELQRSGGKWTSASAFWNGWRDKSKTIFRFNDASEEKSS